MACTGCLAKICTRKVRQMLAGGAGSHGALIVGTVLAWSSAAFRTIVEEMSDVSFNGLWMMVVLGAVIGLIPAGYSADKIGRRLTLMWLSFPAIVGWIFIVTASSPNMIYFGNVLTGLSAGGCSVVAPLYLTEVAEDSLRGMIGSMFHQQMIGGALLGLMSKDDSWRLIAGKAMPIPIVLFVGMYFVPETPFQLLREGKSTEALTALKWLRAAKETDNVDKEFKEIQEAVGQGGSSSLLRPRSLLSSQIIKPISVCMILMILNAMSGVGVMTLYTMAFTPPVFSVANNSSNFLYGIRLMYLTQGNGLKVSWNVVGIILSIVPLITIGISQHFLVTRRKRPLFIFSTIWMSCSHIVLGILYCIQTTTSGQDAEEMNLFWLKFVTLVSLFIGAGLGLSPVPWLMMGELVPIHARGIGSVLVAGTFWITSLIFTFTISIFIYTLGIHYVFWFCATVCAAVFFLGLRAIPETLGKTISEIQEHYSAAIPM